jgi:hypothetical protein
MSLRGGYSIDNIINIINKITWPYYDQAVQLQTA